jgi:hypothetical protein
MRRPRCRPAMAQHCWHSGQLSRALERARLYLDADCQIVMRNLLFMIWQASQPLLRSMAYASMCSVID